METNQVIVWVELRIGDALTLTYDTIDGKHHTGAYAKITSVSKAHPQDCAYAPLGTCPPMIIRAPAELGSIDVEIGLGMLDFDKSAGVLTLAQESPTNTLSRPLGLNSALTSTNIDVIKGTDSITSDPILRQIKTPENLCDIVPSNNYKYAISFYHSSDVGQKTNGLYPLLVGATPFQKYIIENPNGSTNNNRLVVTWTWDGKTNLFDYTWVTNNQAWCLASGDGLKLEQQITTYTNGNTNRTTIIQTCAGTNPICETKEKWQLFPWGEELTQRTLDPTNGTLVNSFTYWTNTTDNGYGRLKQEVLQDNNWRYYDYDTNGRVARILSAFGNQGPTTDTNLCRVTTYDYQPLASSGDNGALFPERERTKIEYLLGHEISRQYFVYLPGEQRAIVSQTPGAVWNASDSLTTVTRTYTNGSFQRELKSILYPNGTKRVYMYATNATQKTTTELFGEADPNSETNILSGTKTQRIIGSLGQTLSVTNYDLASGIITASETFSSFDLMGRPGQVTYLDGTFATYSYSCCGLDTFTDRDGDVTQYTYDALKRQISSTRLSITTTNIFDATDNLLATIRIGNDGSQIPLQRFSYDLAGQIVTETNAFNGVMTYTNIIDGSGQTVKTNTYPDGGTRIETYFKDGSLAKITGTAVQPLRYEYGVESEGGVYRAYTKEIKLDASFADTSEWEKTYTDLVGRAYKTVYASASGTPNSQSFYNNLGQLWKTIDPDSVTNLFGYNAKGEQEFTAIDIDNNGQINTNTIDRVTRTVSDVINNGSVGANVRRTRTLVWATNNSSTSNLVSTAETSVDGLKTWSTVWNSGVGVTNKTQDVYAGSGNRYVTNTAPDNSYTISAYSNGRLVSVTHKDSGNNQILKTTYAYDAHGRQNSVTDARNGTATYTFNNADQIATVVSPIPGTGQAAQTTATYYNQMLQATNVVQPDGGSVFSEYYVNGLLKKTYGSRIYPVGYSYDPQGRMKTMTNWSGFPSSGTQVTTWKYDGYRGFLTNKVYDGNIAGPSYAYTAAARLLTRTWARGTNTTYSYNKAGDLSGVDYSDATTDVTYGYDRRGRQTTITNGTAICTLTYNDANQLLVETNSGGTLNGLAITNAYDTLLRRTTLALNTQPSTLTKFGYDSASRLSSVTNGVNTTKYTYLANSMLVSNIVFKSNATVRLTTTKQYDYLNRLGVISSVPSASSVVSFTYSYNDANQRTRRTESDASFWVYQYDALGQVTSGKKYWNDGTSVPGQQFEYAHDDIGNRTSTKTGGDAVGSALRSASYSANTLNQYTSRDVPNAFDVLGASHATNSVTVNGSAADYRRGEYFQELLTVVNSSTSVWQSVSVANSGGGSTSGNVFVPKTQETFGYDKDGNMTNDGRWTLTWDGENRLANLTSLSTTPSASRLKLDYTYDAHGRRIQKIVSTWNGSTYVAQSTNKFVNDGWNLLAELNNVHGLIRSYVWGLDLSGSEEGAGGVGGLLQVAYYGAQTTNCFAAYDGNGNVAALVNAADGNAVAQYEYGSFGELLRMTGVMAKNNPFRFSTKFTDDESDFLYYGFRYYNPSTGRWPSSDPIEEPGFILLTTGKYVSDDGGPNLYGFASNDGLSNYDRNGLALETGWDAFNVSLDFISLGCNLAEGNVIGALVDGVGLLYDAGATLVPGLPGGAGTIIKLYRGKKLAPKMIDYLVANQTAKNVYRYGVRKGVDEAHHILPQTGANYKWYKGKLRTDMDALRAKATKAGFDIDGAANGVALPTKFHQTLGGPDYYQRVLETFKNAVTKDDFVKGTDKLAEQLLKESGKVP